jgi:hypothetical protein
MRRSTVNSSIYLLLLHGGCGSVTPTAHGTTGPAAESSCM